MEIFKILSGVPANGPLPEQFSASGHGTHHEGLVVEFFREECTSWIGNFQPGTRVVIDIPEGRKDKIAHSVKVGVSAPPSSHPHDAHP